ncbi:alpha/beta fold hydrolase [Rufibacter quisquiliarum]|uniref:Pimeloyl-ACP methyl ester carboxylesterase n=1 Tax=Rufibacter quisquiliarum TaxID=1549639 RepID=A0A839GFJ6_9BACT|nr:alpha/beta hydrolase [Rufibacter quisquiliarum]MBA9078414.1 pimeloyl-ACP methyl ester carboxylesterase [Rufibacter quisquiliarum]
MTPLLLLHGALGADSQFKPLLPLLPAALPVYSFNLAGHGGEPFSDQPFRMESFVQQLLEWLAARQLGPVQVFGYSMGGYVALEAARQQPQRFRKIFTLATKFAWAPETAAHETARLRPEAIQKKVPAFAQTLQQRHAPQDWAQLLHQTADMMRALGQQPLLTSEKLGQIQVPVRVAVGDRDQMVTVEETVAAYRSLPSAQLQVLPDTRHPLEQVSLPLLAQALNQYFAYA